MHDLTFQTLRKANVARNPNTTLTIEEQLASIQIALDLLAHQLGIDLAYVTTQKFNRDSIARGTDILITGLGVKTPLGVKS